MNPGLLNKRISISGKSKTKSSYGGYVEDWVEIAMVWANIKPLRGRELFQAKQVQAEIETKITIRYRTGIKSDMRVTYGDRTFQIVAPPINVDEKNQYLEILCKEVV